MRKNIKKMKIITNYNVNNKIFVNTNLWTRHYRKSSKYDLTLTTELEEIIIGLMLGDLYAERIKETSNTRLQFKQSIKNKAYIDHLYQLFNNYCNTEPKINISKEIRANKKEINESIKF